MHRRISSNRFWCRLACVVSLCSVACPCSSTLGSARTVSGSSAVGFVYILACSATVPKLTPLNANPANYCTVKCPGCRPRLLLCNEPGRQAGSVMSLLRAHEQKAICTSSTHATRASESTMMITIRNRSRECFVAKSNKFIR